MSEKTIFVPVGELHVSCNPEEELITVVGSCVAVVLYDSANHVGGLAHIVLPGRRTALRKDDPNAYYADTGVPLLIEEMLKARACQSQILAEVVGGSSQETQSAEISIGRQNANAALAVLRRAGIAVKREAVGGSCGYRIALDVATGTVNIRQSHQYSVQPRTQYEGPFAKKDVTRLILRIESLKPDADAGGDLLEAIHEPNLSIQSILEIITRDIVLAYHIFRMCNSAYYGLPHKIFSFPDALRLLGDRQFRRICVVAATMRQHKYSLADFGLPAAWLNAHSQATALTVQHLCARTSPQLCDTAYMAGMLHTIGKLGLMLLLIEDRQDTLAGIDYAGFQQQVGNIGKMLLTKWNSPDSIVRAVTDFNNPPAGSSGRHTLTAVLHVACGIHALLDVGVDKRGCVEQIDPDALSQIGLADGLESVLPDILTGLKSAGLQ